MKFPKILYWLFLAACATATWLMWSIAHSIASHNPINPVNPVQHSSLTNSTPE